MNPAKKVFGFIKKSFKNHLGISLAGLVVLMLGVVYLTAELTSTPSFCRTCHNMKPYYKSWQESNHANIACVKCHIRPGLKGKIRAKFEGLIQLVSYVSRAYRRRVPQADIPDANCLAAGCHDTRLLEPGVEFKGVHFDHKKHLTEARRGKKLRCTSCHSQIVQGAHISVTESTCFLCHMKKGDGTFEITKCITCHTDVFDPASPINLKHDHNRTAGKDFACQNCHGEMTVGQGEVPKENCYNCHWERTWLDRYQESEFLHKTHITDNKVDCSRCHTPIKHEPLPKSAHFAGDCIQCHSKIHVAEEKVFKGEDGDLSDSVPSIKFSKGMNCKACHIYEKELKDGTLVSIATKKTCARCHDQGFTKLYQEWEQAGARRIERIQKVIAGLTPVIEQLEDPRQKQKAADLVKTAGKSTELIAHGHNVHNAGFSKKVLAQAAETLREAAEIAGKPQAADTVTRSFIKFKSRCLDCHSYIEEKSDTAFGSDFSHRRHTVDSNIKCIQCHAASEKYDGVPHGKLLQDSLQSCLSCHHTLEGAKETCRNCHAAQKSIFEGKVPWSDKIQPSAMYEAEIGCAGCHLNQDDKIVRPSKAVCLNCHDEGFDEILEGWSTDTQQLMQKARAKADAGKLTPRELKGLEFLEKGRCKGSHNYNVTNEFLTQITGE